MIIAVVCTNIESWGSCIPFVTVYRTMEANDTAVSSGVDWLIEGTLNEATETSLHPNYHICSGLIFSPQNIILEAIQTLS